MSLTDPSAAKGTISLVSGVMANGRRRSRPALVRDLVTLKRDSKSAACSVDISLNLADEMGISRVRDTSYVLCAGTLTLQDVLPRSRLLILLVRLGACRFLVLICVML